MVNKITTPPTTSELIDKVNEIIDDKQDKLTQAQLDAVNSGANATNIAQITANAQAISTETTNRESADNNLQSQIDAIVSSSDVFDIVGTYAELQAYDITTVPVNDIIKVLVDSTHSNAATYYRCVETGGVKSWLYIGSEGAYYTKAEANAAFVPQTRTVNNKALSSNITLTANDVGADAIGSASTAETNSKNYADSLAVNYATAAQGALADTAVQPTDLTNYVTTNTDQDITGIKTFVGEKRIKFKQSASGNKLGFTLYDNNNKEAAAFEYRPNTINSYPLMYLGQYKGSGTSYISTPIYVGFRCYDTAYNASYNLVAPLAKDAKTPFNLDTNYKTLYLPLGVTDGNTTVTTGSNGVLDISSLLSGGGSSYTAGTGIDITNDVISVDGVKDQQNTSTAIKTWTGTRAQYDAIVTKDSNTLYNITDDSNMAVSLLQTIYPVGSIYIGTMNTCPLAALFGTWTLVSANRVLQGSGNYNAGSTVEAGLPNITGNMYKVFTNGQSGDGVFSATPVGLGDVGAVNWDQQTTYNFDASRSNPIYGNSLTVQPPAYVVNIWERTA